MPALFYGDDLTRELLGHFSASDKCSYRNHDVEERHKMPSLGREVAEEFSREIVATKQSKHGLMTSPY